MVTVSSTTTAGGCADRMARPAGSRARCRRRGCCAARASAPGCRAAPRRSSAGSSTRACPRAAPARSRGRWRSPARRGSRGAAAARPSATDAGKGRHDQVRGAHEHLPHGAHERQVGLRARHGPARPGGATSSWMWPTRPPGRASKCGGGAVGLHRRVATRASWPRASAAAARAVGERRRRAPSSSASASPSTWPASASSSVRSDCSTCTWCGLAPAACRGRARRRPGGRACPAPAAACRRAAGALGVRGDSSRMLRAACS